MTKHKTIDLQNGLNELKVGSKFFDGLIQRLGESLYEEVDFDSEQDNIDFVLDVANRFRSKLAAFLHKKDDKFLVEFSDEELQILTRKELNEARQSAIEFDGFEGFRVVGKII